MATRPEAVVFDLGKVLLDFDYGIVIGKLAKRGRLSVVELRHLLVESPLLPAYERGELSSEAFYEEVRRATGFDGDYEAFTGYFVDIFRPIERMVALQAELRGRGVPTYIFSNTNDLAVGHIRRTYPFFAGFDGYVLSYEHGSMKPDAPLYEVVERVTGREGGALMYFDDRPENVEAGAARGWQAVVHADPEESWARVRAAGLLGCGGA
jgi:FMN phosphatase YigB (HAD superfamily)